MSDTSTKIRAELSELIASGSMLQRREVLATATAEERKLLADGLTDQAATRRPARARKTSETKADPKVAAFMKELLTKPDFGKEYQAWYTPALRVVEQVLPDRLEEFRTLYRHERPKQTDVETYSIADYIAGIRVTTRYGTEEAFSSRQVAMQKLNQQVDMLGTAAGRLDSLLTDIARELQADLLDDEISAARNLHSAAHLRSAGVVAGVVLEAHLKRLVEDHNVSLPLTVWFEACWLFASGKDRMSALSLQRPLEIGSYATAGAMLDRLRSVLVRPGRDRLTGPVEVDETAYR